MNQRPEVERFAGSLLQVESLYKRFPVTSGVLFQRTSGQISAVDGVTFSVERGETFGLVGETGCGKSTTGRVIAGFLPPTQGRVIFDGHEQLHMNRHPGNRIAQEIQMIAQDPYSSLNPRHTVGSILAAPFRYQKVTPEGGVRRAVQYLLERVGLSPGDHNRFPDEFSGGQRQRIAIARAIALGPRLIVADEPVSALDVSIRAQVLNLLDDLQRENGLSYLFISHDLSVVRHIANRVAVMYLGKIVEVADRDQLYSQPLHPYTHALLSSAPVPDPQTKDRPRIRLQGEVPSPGNPPAGCRFSPRCWKAQEICLTLEPQLTGKGRAHEVACHFPEPPVQPGGPAATADQSAN
ncbi:MAG: ABC transporter ATP-binding protein [Candidatus Dormibacteria bacterium]